MTDSNYWTILQHRISRRGAIRGGVGVSVATGLYMAGCGGDSGSKAATTATAAAAKASGTAAAAAAKAPTGKVTVTLNSLGDQIWDGALTSGLNTEFFHAHVGEALAIMGPINNQYVPGVASSWEVPSPDGLTWVFTIRDGIKFHDGTTLTADDVKYTVDRWMNPKTSPVVGVTLQKVVDKVEVQDKKVTFKFKEPLSVIPTLAVTRIMPRAAVEAAGASFVDKPIGSGPFKFGSSKKDQFAALQAFEQHYRQVPAFKDLQLQIVPEVTTRLASLQTGESDIMLKPSGPSIAAIEGNKQLKLIDIPSTSLNGISFKDLTRTDTNTKTAWADIRMRQAVAHAVDVDAIIDKIYFKRAVRAAVPGAVPGLPGVPALKPLAYDPKKATDLIAAAGHKGLEFSIYSYDSGAQAGNIDSAQAVGTYLNTVGFKTQVKPVELVTFFNNIRGDVYINQNAISTQVLAGRAEETFLSIVDPKGSTPHYYSEALAAEAKKLYTITGKELEAAVGALSQKLYDLLVYVPLASQNYIIGQGARVKPWKPRMRAGYEFGMEYIEPA